MNKILMFFLMIVFITFCSDQINVSESAVCEDHWNQNRFDKTFRVCMGGQRAVTGADDADDFVKECRRTAVFSAETRKNCKRSVWVCRISSAQIGTSYVSWKMEACDTKPVSCSRVVSEEFKKACAWFQQR